MTRPRSLLSAKYPGKIGAWVAEMAYDIAAPIHEAILCETNEGTLGYNDPISIAQGRNSVSAWLLRSYGWDVEPTSVGFVSDVVSGFAAVLRHFVPAGSPVVVPTPAYGPFLTVPELFGHPVIRVPMCEGPFGPAMDIGGIERALHAGARLVVLCNPHNPTGRSYRRAELAALADVVQAHQARVFSDEVHAPLNLSGRPHLPYAALDARTAGHTITATSASKTWNISGLKCAQLLFSAAHDAETWQGVASHYVRSVSRLGVAALRAAYEEPESQEWLSATLERLRRNSESVVRRVNSEMPGISCRPAESTYLAWLDCTRLGVADPARLFHEHAGVALCDGEEFGSPGYVRLNFALPEARLERALDAMAEAVATEQRQLSSATGQTIRSTRGNA